MMDDRALAQAAIYLRNAAPEQWQAFVREVETVAQNAAMVLVRSSATDIMSDQGWAKASLWFLRSFKDCDERVRAPKKPAAETPPR